jgi:shikimate 5-dehydrogenase
VADRRVFRFIGVTPSNSAMNAIFPRWAALLGLDDVALQPVDLPLDTWPERYRAEVLAIRADPSCTGALVTSHKVRLLAAARDLFVSLDDDAELLGEVSYVANRSAGLAGGATDRVAGGRALADFVPPRHFERTGGHVLCVGSGGAGLAIAAHLLTQGSTDRPVRVVLVGRTEARLAACRSVLARLGVLDSVTFACHEDPRRNDALLSALPAGSLVINATGLGKDRPGSPISDAGRFPERGLAWDLNYRGELRFLAQAREQAASRALVLEDGWRYFVHGWAEVIARVFDVAIDDAILRQLATAAEPAR